MKYCYSFLTLLLIVFFTNSALGQDTPCSAIEIPLTNIAPTDCTNNGGNMDVDLSGLTPSGLPNPSCPGSVFSSTDNDGWFYFDVPSNSTSVMLDFTTASCSGCTVGYAVYEGDCSSPTALGASCGASNASNPGPFSFAGLTSGGRYYVRTWEASNTSTTINLSVQSGPENDECINALPISGIGCNYGATDTEPDAYQVGQDNGVPSGSQVTSPWTPDPFPYKSGVPSICESPDPNAAIYHWNRNNNAVWYTFTVAPSTPQPVSLQINNVECTGGNALLQMGIWSNNNTCDLAAETFYGCATGIGTVTITDVNLPVGDYYFLVDGASGAECEWVFESAQIFCSIFAGDDKDFCEGDDISVALGGTPSTNDPNPVITWTSSPASAISLVDDPNSANPIFTLNNAAVGTYEFYVQLDGSEPGCLSRDTVIVTVNPAITASATAVNSGACTNEPITLTAEGNGGSAPYTYEWDNTATSESIDVNPSNTTEYFVTVTDANGCSAVASVTVDPTTTPPNTNLNLTADANSVCEGGEVILTLSNSEGGINYQLTMNGMPVGPLIGGTGGAIMFGPYTVSSNTTFGLIASNTSDSDCRLVINNLASVTVNPNPEVSITATTPEACSEEPTTITASASGGSGDYTYNWDNGLGSGASQTVNPSIETTYTVTVIDNVTGCIGSENIVVQPSTGVPNGNLDITLANNPICINESTTLTINNSQVGFSYKLTLDGVGFGAAYPGTGGPIEIGTPALSMTTTYGILVFSDINPNCFALIDDAVTITVLEPPTSANAGPDQTICSATTLTNLMAVLPAGSTGEWTQVSGPTTVGFSDINDPSAQISNLAAGTYVFNWEVRNTACTGDDQTASDQVTIIIGNLNVTPTITGTSAIGANDGAIALCVEGGDAPYTLSYTPTEGSSTTVSGTCDENYLISGLTQKCFTITVEDANGCQWLDEVCVPGPNCTDFNIDDVFTTNETCNENNDGSITIITNNGQGNLTYTITDTDGNTQTFTTTSTSHTFTGLEAGSYSIVVTDERGCNISYLFNPVIITEPNALTATFTATAPSTDGGSDGSVSICVNGGTAPYVVNSTPAAITAPTQTGCDANFTVPGLEAGVYDITVTDANGCEYMLQAVVPPPTCAISITNTSFEEPSCNGDSDGTVTVTVSGNGTSFQYSVDNGPFTAATTDVTFTFTGLNAGSHTITVVDNFNCNTSTTIVITEPTMVMATYTATPPTTIGGSDGSISTCINGGTAPYSASIVPDPSAVVTSAGSTASCEEVINITGLPAGSYAITITDANGCTFTIQNAVVPETACSDLQIETAVAQDVNCFGESDGQATITVTGGTAPYSYSINGGITFVPAGGTNSTSYTFTDLDAGTYTVFVQDASLCQVSTTVTIAEPTTLPTATVNIVNPSAIGASDGQVCITPSGGTAPYTVTADCGTVVTGAGDQCGGTFHIDNLPAGECFIELVDANGCTAQARITLQDPLCADFMLEGVSVNNYSCTDAIDGSVTVTVSGGQAPYTYVIDGVGTFISSETSFTFENLAEGVYTGISVTDNRGCEVSLAGGIAITNVSPLEIDFTTTSACTGNDGTINVTVTGGTPDYTYNWAGSLPNSPTLSDLEAGTYNLTVVDANGCGTSTPITVAGSSLEIAAFVVSPDCNGEGNGVIDITVSGGDEPYAYDWSGDLPSTEDQNLLSEGTYGVTVTDANGCSVEQSFTIVRSDISVELAAQGTCDGSENGMINTTVTGGTEPFTYTWLPDIGNVEDPTDLADGIYTLTITDANGCEAMGSATVEEFENPTVEVSSDVTINKGETTQLTATPSGGTSPYTVLWSPSIGLDDPTSLTPIASPEQTTTYTVTITDANGCTATDVVTVTVEDNPFVKIPTGFTPNGDGNNDTFGPVTNFDLDVTVFKIFNRWGQTIYDDPNGRWDGQFQSVDQPLGTYVYLIEYLDQNSEKQVVKGHVNLIR